MHETDDGRPADGPDGDVRIPFEGRLDLRQVLGIHQRGRGDPAMRFEASGSCWRASRTPDGPVALFVERTNDDAGGEPVVRIRAWGPGTAWALEQAPALLGLDDIHRAITPAHPAVAAAQRAVGEVRIGRSGRVLEALLPAILEQKVTGAEASRAYRGLIARWGEPAPGPAGRETASGRPGLRLPPAPEVIARLPYHALHPVGLERRRAELLAAVCRDADRLEALGSLAAAAAAEAGPDARPEARAAAYAALEAYPGIGPWTVAEVGLRAFGDPDVVSVGDFHVPNMVAWALAREPRGTDERMLELLEPYRGQRGRVVRLLELAGIRAPRYGPRLSARRIDLF
jgi:3-methyladenine DNA glycosylase/8-oxoguanine DNA glycosylase